MSNRQNDNVISLRRETPALAFALAAQISNRAQAQVIDFSTAHALRKLAEVVENSNHAAFECTIAINAILRGLPEVECDALRSPEALYSMCSATISLIDARGCLDADLDVRRALMTWIDRREASDERPR